jgi:hypothetical protein
MAPLKLATAAPSCLRCGSARHVRPREHRLCEQRQAGPVRRHCLPLLVADGQPITSTSGPTRYRCEGGGGLPSRPHLM